MTRLVAVAACTADADGVDLATVRMRYVEALRSYSDCAAVVVPLADAEDAAAILSRCDGLLLTGSVSNVHPATYGGDPAEGMALDPRRDDTVRHLLRAALRRDLPVLGICRGLQELNVCLGGDLWPDLRRVPGLLRHDEDTTLPRDEQYAAAHDVALVEDGLLHRLWRRDRVPVSSLHKQGVARVGEGLVVEATAPDGLVEALRVEGATFALAVQWHPEWLVARDDAAQELFHAFGDACAGLVGAPR